MTVSKATWKCKCGEFHEMQFGTCWKCLGAQTEGVVRRREEGQYDNGTRVKRFQLRLSHILVACAVVGVALGCLLLRRNLDRRAALRLAKIGLTAEFEHGRVVRLTRPSFPNYLELAPEDVRAIGSCAKLRNLNLSNTSLGDDQLSSLLHLDELETIALDKTQISFGGLLSLREWKKLRLVFVHADQFTPDELIKFEEVVGIAVSIVYDLPPVRAGM